MARHKALTQRIDHEIEFFKHGDAKQHMRAHNHGVFVHPTSHNFDRKNLRGIDFFCRSIRHLRDCTPKTEEPKLFSDGWGQHRLKSSRIN